MVVSLWVRAQPGTKREDIRTIFSHSHLLLQSEKYLTGLEKENGCHPIGRQCTFDSAGACAMVDSPTKAAISSRRAGLSAGLEIVDRGGARRVGADVRAPRDRADSRSY